MVILDDMEISSIVWMIDNFDRNHKLGFRYEATVGNGKLLVCQGTYLWERVRKKYGCLSVC